MLLVVTVNVVAVGNFRSAPAPPSPYFPSPLPPDAFVPLPPLAPSTTTAEIVVPLPSCTACGEPEHVDAVNVDVVATAGVTTTVVATAAVPTSTTVAATTAPMRRAGGRPNRRPSFGELPRETDVIAPP